MGDPEKPADATPRKAAQLASIEELGSVWDGFRSGSVVHCGKDDAPLALAVDAAAGAYRFVCTQCGNASPWFESSPNGIRVRNAALAIAAGSTMSDD
jgi:hypothetical protein